MPKPSIFMPSRFPSSMPNSAKNKIIIAVDAPNAKAALKLVDQLSGQGCLFKIGLQLFTAEGPSIVREIQARGARVFLDLKFHDIPNTVAGAVRAAFPLPNFSPV